MLPTSDPLSGRFCLSWLTAARTGPEWKLLLCPHGPLARAGLLKAPQLLNVPSCHAAVAVVYFGPAFLGSPSPTVVPFVGSCLFCVAGC